MHNGKIKEKRPLYKGAWFWILVVIVVLAIAGSGGSDSDSDSPADASNAAATVSQASSTDDADEKASDEPYIVTDEEVDTSNSYYWTVTGKPADNTDRDIGYIPVEYVLYDEDGAQIGTAFDNTSNLKAGKTWKYSATCIDNIDQSEIASYELAEVTGF